MAGRSGSSAAVSVARSDDGGVTLTTKVDGVAIPLVKLDGARVRQLVENASAAPAEDDNGGEGEDG